MARMFRPYRAEDVFGDFSGQATVSNSARASIAGGRHVFDIRHGDSGEWIRYPVDFIIGSKWQQAYATRLSDSRIAVFPVQYSRKKGSWLNYWSVVDGPNSERTDISRFHEVPAGAVYQTSCAPCHTSQLDEREDARRGVIPGSRSARVPRRGDQLRDVSRAVARAHRARQGWRHGSTHEHLHAGELCPPAGGAIRRHLRAMPFAVGGARRAGERGGELLHARCRSIAPTTLIFRRIFRAKRSTGTAGIARPRLSARRSRARSASGKGTRPAVHATTRILPTPPRTRRL